MVNYLKDGTIVLSNWVQLGMGSDYDWIKHRLPFKKPHQADMIRLHEVHYSISKPSFGIILWQGADIKYVEDSYKLVYGDAPFKIENLSLIKQQIETFLDKIDDLKAFV